MVVDFCVKEAARKLVPRERYQQGSITKEGQRRKVWRLRWHPYVLKPDGTEIRAHRSATLDADRFTKTDARKKLDEILRKECGSAMQDDGISVEQFYREVFLPTRTWSGNTTRNNEFTWKNHVAPFFGAMRIGDVRRHHVDRFYLTKQGVGLSTLVQIRNAVSTVFEYAEDNGFVRVHLKQPKLKMKKLAKETAKTKVLTFDQAKQLAKMTGEHGLAYRLLLYCGLRIGELLALRVSDIREATLIVDESVESGGKLKGTKGGETREVPLPAALRTEVLADSEGREFVFQNKLNGQWITNQAARLRWLDRARAESGIPELDFHCVRRTMATLLKDRGFAQTKDIQAILGHSEESMTNRHYIKPVEASQHRAIEQMYAAITEAIQ